MRVKFWDAGCKKPHEQIRMLKEGPEVVIQHSKLNPLSRTRPLFAGFERRNGFRCRYRSPKPCVDNVSYNEILLNDISEINKIIEINESNGISDVNEISEHNENNENNGK